LRQKHRISPVDIDHMLPFKQPHTLNASMAIGYELHLSLSSVKTPYAMLSVVQPRETRVSTK
jgi:hypothetical protein